MGWWRLSEALIWGDGVSEIAEEAIRKIDLEYHENHGRTAFKAELHLGFMFAVISHFKRLRKKSPYRKQIDEMDIKLHLASLSGDDQTVLELTRKKAQLQEDRRKSKVHSIDPDVN